ncbi:hypothetical protein PIB30_098637, partial [Stylosanthes scabra]|nr:hypothetical protein [Stylosanthes scabra]
PHTKFVGERPTSSRTRSRRATAQAAVEREPSPFNEIIFDSREQYERSKLIFNRESLHEQFINFENQGPDFMPQRIEELGWSFISPIAENAIHYFLGINGDPVSKEEDAYEKNLTEKRAGRLNMDAVLNTITALRMRWDTYNPKSDRVENGILTANSRGWLKMIICNLQLLRHETTFSMETAMLLYTLMRDGRIHLSRILNKSVYQATSAAQEIPTYPEDQIIIVLRKEKFCPFADWQQVKKKARKADLPQANPLPILPPIHEPQDQPTTSSAAATPPAPTKVPSCTNLFKKILKNLRRRKKDLRNTQYMIRTANPGMEFPDLIPVSSSDSDNEDYN